MSTPIPFPNHFTPLVIPESVVEVAPGVYYYRRDETGNPFISASGVLVDGHQREVSVVFGLISFGHIETMQVAESGIRRHGSFESFVGYCQSYFGVKFYPLHDIGPAFSSPPLLEPPHEPGE